MRLTLVFAAGMALGIAPATRADVIPVTTTVDEFGSGAGCSLREAIKAANDDLAFGGCPSGNGDDQITVPAGTYTLAIPGTGEDNDATGDLDVLQNVTITGAGAGVTIIDGGGLDRVFDVTSGITASISDLTLRNGVATGDAGGALFSGATLTMSNVEVTGNTADSGALALTGPSSTLTACTISGNTAAVAGGGVLIRVGANAVILRSTISGNSAPSGGGILNLDTLVVANSTISGNTATTLDGGGIYNNGTLTLSSVTIASNAAPAGDVGGMFNNDSLGTTSMRNSILGDNTSATAGDADCGGTIDSGGHNLIETTGACTIAGSTTGNLTGVDAQLLPLADNGGPTQTQMLLAGSPALDAGDPAVPGSGGTACEATDQIGTTRPVGSACDIGAVEAPMGGVTTTSSSSTSTSSTSTSSSSTSTTSSSTSSTSSTSTTSSSSTSTTSTSTTSSTSTTLSPVCANGASISNAIITLSKLGVPSGNERVTFTGRLDFPAGVPSTFDPVTTGAQVLIEDLATSSPMGAFDLTALTLPVPPGAPGTGCAPHDGWRGTTYHNTSDALGPPACPAYSANGLKVLKLLDRRARGKGISFAISARNATIGAVTGPLRGTIVLGATATESQAGECGVITFDAGHCIRKGATLRCR